MFELEASETFINSDVKETLDKLKEEYQLYCYTNLFYNQALKKLEYHDLLKYFTKVYSVKTPILNFLKWNLIIFLIVLMLSHRKLL